MKMMNKKKTQTKIRHAKTKQNKIRNIGKTD